MRMVWRLCAFEAGRTSERTYFREECDENEGLEDVRVLRGWTILRMLYDANKIK
jgi:hypothetical protein